MDTRAAHSTTFSLDLYTAHYPNNTGLEWEWAVCGFWPTAVNTQASQRREQHWLFWFLQHNSYWLLHNTQQCRHIKGQLIQKLCEIFADGLFILNSKCRPLFHMVPILWIALVALARRLKSIMLASAVSLRKVWFQKARRRKGERQRKGSFHPRLFDMSSDRHGGKEMTTLVSNRDGVHTERRGRWREPPPPHTHTQTNSPLAPFPPALYILIRGKICPELSHIVRNFLSEWQVNPHDMAFADSIPNLDSKTQNFRPDKCGNVVEAFSNPDKEKIENKQIDWFILQQHNIYSIPHLM